MSKTKQLLVATATVGLLALGSGIAIAENESARAEPAQTSSTTTSSPRPALDGAKVYAWNCGVCHSERWPKERSDAEWDVIATHMRVRANLTAAQTEAVLQYLKGNN